MKYQGSCHCGQVVFEVDGELEKVTDCNCSICTRMGSLHWFVPRERLVLLTSESAMKSYRFGARTIVVARRASYGRVGDLPGMRARAVFY